MATVSLKDVGKVYPGGVRAVFQANLQVADGELLVLVGPSGCGKSTVLRMIAGLEDISEGTIRIGERMVNRVPPKDRDIAMVFQNYALYPHMSVRGNMAFALKLRRYPKAEIDQRIQRAAKMLELEALLERKPKALSGGQRQRVALGRAIVRNPAVFLFDEPLSNLDAKLRVQTRVQISELHHELGATMIYVTHDQVEAMTLGNRLVVMKDGVIQQVADPLTMYAKPSNRFVAGFIGTPPMNFLSGQIRAEGDGLRFAGPAGFSLPVPTAYRQVLAAYRDREVTLGLRPEDIGSAAAERQEQAPRLRATVSLVEPMGAEQYVYFSLDQQTCIGRVDAHASYRRGDNVSPAVMADKVHFFEVDSGRVLV